jgi:hypothetical protein
MLFSAIEPAAISYRTWFALARRLSRCLAPLAITIAFGALSAHAADDDVLTQHNDNARSGAQSHETTLKPGNISATTFGRLYMRHVDGQVIAQPLYASNLAIPGKGTHNVVFVVTRKNVVYAFDADNLDPDPMHGLLWNQPITVEPAGLFPTCAQKRAGRSGSPARRSSIAPAIRCISSRENPTARSGCMRWT